MLEIILNVGNAMPDAGGSHRSSGESLTTMQSLNQKIVCCSEKHAK